MSPGTFSNYGTFVTSAGSYFRMTGTFYNNVGGVVSNNGSFYNYEFPPEGGGMFVNSGCFEDPGWSHFGGYKPSGPHNSWVGLLRKYPGMPSAPGMPTDWTC